MWPVSGALAVVWLIGPVTVLGCLFLFLNLPAAAMIMLPAWAALATGFCVLLGALLMIAAAITGPLPGPGGIPLFLLGLAATFFALTRLKVEPQPWAIWPAGALAAISLLSFTSSGGWIVPVVLIGVGGWLLVRSGAIDLGGPRSATPPAPTEPSPYAEPPAFEPPPAPEQPAGPSDPYTPDDEGQRY